MWSSCTLITRRRVRWRNRSWWRCGRSAIHTYCFASGRWWQCCHWMYLITHNPSRFNIFVWVEDVYEWFCSSNSNILNFLKKMKNEKYNMMCVCVFCCIVDCSWVAKITYRCCVIFQDFLSFFQISTLFFNTSSTLFDHHEKCVDITQEAMKSLI